MSRRQISRRSHDEIIEMNGKPQMKDAATEVETFETEMEIKSSCILGKVGFFKLLVSKFLDKFVFHREFLTTGVGGR